MKTKINLIIKLFKKKKTISGFGPRKFYVIRDKCLTELSLPEKTIRLKQTQK